MRFDRQSALLTATVTILLCLHWWLAVSATFQKSFTSDETAHLTAGYSYWKLNDYRLQPENGNLPQRWAALPLLIEGPRIAPESTPNWWSLSHIWLLCQRFLFESGNNTGFMLATSRAMMGFWSVATGLQVFLWSRRLWGPAGGVLSLCLYVFSTTTLAHGSLVTSDMTVSFWLLAAVGAFWRHLERPGAVTLALSLAATGIAAVSKFSFLLLAPVFVLLALWHLTTEGRPKPVRYAWLAGSAIGHVAAVFFAVWMFFGFRYHAGAPDMPVLVKFYVPWEVLLPTDGFWRFAMLRMKEWRLFPEAFIHGFAYVKYASAERGAYLLGQYSITGWFWFFPYAFLVKSTLAELFAIVLAACAVASRWLRARGHHITTLTSDLRHAAPLMALLLVYGSASILSHLNIGHRHILPLYPPLFILAGLLARPAAGRTLRAIAVGLCLAAAAEAMLVYPNYLSYFNRLAGGSANGWRHLSDSSIDWGQDLPALATWLESNRQPEETVYFSYFGMADYRYEGIQAEPLAPYYQQHRPRYWKELEPGLYCIGATMLHDAYSPWSGRWNAGYEKTYQILLKRLRKEIAQGQRGTLIEEFGEGESQPLWNLDRLRFSRLCNYLRIRGPDFDVNSSILIYRLTQQEVDIVVNGTPEQLTTLMEGAFKRSQP